MPPEFIAIIAFGGVRRVGLLILGWMLRDVPGMVREVSVSIRIHVLRGRRIGDALRQLKEKGIY